jgi:hypothetical protein
MSSTVGGGFAGGRGPAMTRGLNRNHNRVVKDVFKGAAMAAATRAGALQDWYQGLIKRGMREELARVTLARKLAALTLRLWKHGERYDATQLTVQARASALTRAGVRARAAGSFISLVSGSDNTDAGAEGSLISGVRPARRLRYSPNHRLFRRTRRSVGPIFAMESPIEPWFAPRDPGA